MSNTAFFSAVLRHRRAIPDRAVAVAIALSAAIAGCGGTVASSGQPDLGDAGSLGVKPPGPAACPTNDELERGVAVGKSCADEGAYCTNVACNPCTRSCPAVSCVHGVWKTAVNTATCTGGDNGDASPPPNQCVTIEPSSFDQSCHSDSDCFLVSAGTFCPDVQRCSCPNATISVDDRTRYQNEAAKITWSQLVCPCVAPGVPRCVQNHCTLCGPGASHPGCPDAG